MSTVTVTAKTEELARQAQLKKQYEDVSRWVRVNGIQGVMHRTAKHLLPGRKFAFVLNMGGGSMTDSKTITIGIPEITWGMDKEIIFSVTKALTGHESEHIESTDFEVYVNFQGEVQQYFKKHFNLEMTPKLGASLLNMTEDGRIEKRLVNRFKGYKKHIQLLNALFWKHGPCRGQNEMMDFISSISSLTVTGLKSKDWELHYAGTEVDALLDEINPLILKAINNPTAEGCAEDTMEIVKIIAPYLARKHQDIKNRRELEKLLPKAPPQSDKPKKEGGSGSGNDEPQPGNTESSHFLMPEEAEKGNGKGEEDENENTEGKDGEEDENSKSDANSKSKKKSESKSKGEDSEENEDEEGEELKGTKEGGDDEEEDSSGKNSEDKKDGEDVKSDDLDNKSADGSQPKQSDGDEAPSQSPSHTKEEINDFIDEMIEALKSDVYEEALEQMKQGAREAERERKAEEQENTFLGHLSPEDMKGLDKRVTYRNIDPVSNRRALMPADVLKRGRQMKKELEKLFKTKQTFTSRNRRSGILDSNNLWKKGIKEYDMFVKKGIPNNTETVINILVDASGSMFGRVDGGGTKLDKATEATAMIEEALRDMVPTRISYFTGHSNLVIHSTVKDFNQTSKDTLSWKRLPAVPNSANRDGYSIKIGTAEILKRPENKKILIVLSDGLPTEPTRREGQKEVMEAVRAARQAGVIVIAIAFGDDEEMEENREVYKAMYQKGIIMVRPEEIHKHLAKTIENELKR